jgi:DNA replication protein
MTQFKGFPVGKDNLTAIPNTFFSELLPLIDDLAELKVMLFCFWALPQRDIPYPYLTWTDFTDSEALMGGLSVIDGHLSAEDALEQGLKSAVERGGLLAVTVDNNGKALTLYFANTERGRLGAEQVKIGNWQATAHANRIAILPERPTIYKLYENNIGMLTPLIADELKDAEAEFGAGWIEEAIKIAVEMNKRNWRYVRAIMERWKKDGKQDESGRRSQETWEKFITGKHGDIT